MGPTQQQAAATAPASLEESSYQGGTMGGDHPIAWCREYEGGRSFHSGGGHTEASSAGPAFRQHLLGGVRWAAGTAQAPGRTPPAARKASPRTAEQPS